MDGVPTNDVELEPADSVGQQKVNGLSVAFKQLQHCVQTVKT